MILSLLNFILFFFANQFQELIFKAQKEKSEIVFQLQTHKGSKRGS